MRRFHVFCLSVASFLLVTFGSVLKKAVLFSMCGLLMMEPGMCVPWMAALQTGDGVAKAADHSAVVAAKDAERLVNREMPQQQALPQRVSQAGADVPMVGMFQLLESGVASCPAGSYEIEGHFNAGYTAFTVDRTDSQGAGCFGSLPRQMFEASESFNSGEAVVYGAEGAGPNEDLDFAGQLTMFGQGLFTGGFVSAGADESSPVMVGSLNLNAPDVVLDNRKVTGALTQLNKAGNLPAIANLPDLDVTENAFSEKDWTEDETGLQMSRNLLGVMLTKDATVEQLNHALKAVGGVIVSSLNGLPGVTVAVPDTGNFRGLERAEAILNLYDGVSFVSRGLKLEAPELNEGTAPELVEETDRNSLIASVKESQKQSKEKVGTTDSKSILAQGLTSDQCQRDGEVIPLPLLLEGLTDICGEIIDPLTIEEVNGKGKISLYVRDRFQGEKHPDLNLRFSTKNKKRANQGSTHGFMVAGLMGAISGNQKNSVGAFPRPIGSPSIIGVPANSGLSLQSGLLKRMFGK